MIPEPRDFIKTKEGMSYRNRKGELISWTPGNDVMRKNSCWKTKFGRLREYNSANWKCGFNISM